MFTHLENKINYELKATTTKTGRLYKTPEGDEFPSVTTVLGYRSKEAILAWRKRVGEEEANRISRHAAGRGTKVHYLAEDHINNKEIPVERNRWLKKILKKIFFFILLFYNRCL